MSGLGFAHSRWGQRTLERGSSTWDVSEAQGQRPVQVVWPISPSMQQACPGRQFQGMSVGLRRRWVIVLHTFVCQLGWAEGTRIADTGDPWVCLLETRCDSVTERRDSFPGQGASANPVGPTRQRAEEGTKSMLSFLVLGHQHPGSGALACRPTPVGPRNPLSDSGGPQDPHVLNFPSCGQPHGHPTLVSAHDPCIYVSMTKRESLKQEAANQNITLQPKHVPWMLPMCHSLLGSLVREDHGKSPSWRAVQCPHPQPTWRHREAGAESSPGLSSLARLSSGGPCGWYFLGWQTTSS